MAKPHIPFGLLNRCLDRPNRIVNCQSLKPKKDKDAIRPLPKERATTTLQVYQPKPANADQEDKDTQALKDQANDNEQLDMEDTNNPLQHDHMEDNDMKSDKDDYNTQEQEAQNLVSEIQEQLNNEDNGNNMVVHEELDVDSNNFT